MNSPPASTPEDAHPYRWTMLAAGWLAYLGFGFMASSMAPLVPQITADLQISNTSMGLVLGAWQFVYIGSAIACGAFLDRFGIRRGILVAGLMIALSGVLRASAQNLSMLLLAVGVFGLGGPLISVGSPKLVSLWFGGADRGRAMGIIVTGPAVGGILALSLTHSVLMPLFDGHWRSVLLFNAGVVFCIALFWLLVTSHPAARANERLAAAEKKPPQMDTLRALLGVPAVRIIMVMNVGILAFNHGFNSWLPELLRHGGMPPDRAGYWAALPPLVGIFASPYLGRFATPQYRFRLLTLLLGAAVLAMVLLQFHFAPALFVGLLLQGFSRGSLGAILLLVLIESKGVGAKHAGAAGGLYFTAGEIGGVLGPVAIGTAYDLTGEFAAGLAGTTLLLLALIAMVSLLKRVERTARVVS